MNTFSAKETKSQLIKWIQDYFVKNGTPETKAMIGISGGKDSTITAALCVEALGKDRVIGVLMPDGEQYDIATSWEVCKLLGIDAHVINIGQITKNLLQEISLSEIKLSDITTINTPARIRMTILYAVAGSLGGRVANTCNASEKYIGWSTKNGDDRGDFSPLGNLLFRQVKAIGYELGLPEHLIEKTPIDGLQDKTDEEAFGFSYEQLDDFIISGTSGDCDIDKRIMVLHENSYHKRNPIPTFEQ